MTTGTAVVDLDGVLYAADTFAELAIHLVNAGSALVRRAAERLGAAPEAVRWGTGKHC
ncbi:hypothetical protein [Saccharopolyspora spinosa]|uniref:Uncharacterized protein n=1 Tax=Saccharopolyspora spinosa TaxID=60894 RepID=A0A2N3Y3A7_SACSN|nr:hypothetical protein [Saccharopolyspora spinosa]PKW17402.1 hypothetical protein A8926_5361 [Saccharopolyspora spinosa]